MKLHERWAGEDAGPGWCLEKGEERRAWGQRGGAQEEAGLGQGQL